MSRYHTQSEWQRFSKQARKRIDKALPLPCVNSNPAKGCTGMVYPGQRYDVAHMRSHHLDPFTPPTMHNTGPAHVACNRSDGGRLGGAIRRRKAGGRDEKLPGPDSGW